MLSLLVPTRCRSVKSQFIFTRILVRYILCCCWNFLRYPNSLFLGTAEAPEYFISRILVSTIVFIFRNFVRYPNSIFLGTAEALSMLMTMMSLNLFHRHSSSFIVIHRRCHVDVDVVDIVFLFRHVHRRHHRRLCLSNTSKSHSAWFCTLSLYSLYAS